MEHPKIIQLKEYLKENNMSKKEFAEKCGFTEKKLNYIMENTFDYVGVPLSDLMTISEVMGVPYLDPKVINCKKTEKIILVD